MTVIEWDHFSSPPNNADGHIRRDEQYEQCLPGTGCAVPDIECSIALNDVLDKNSRDSFKKTILNLETTVETMNSSLSSFNSIIDSSKVDFDITLNNTKKITSNFVKFSDTIVNANFGSTIKTFQTTLDNVNTLLSNIENGSGTVGKLMNDDQMYQNLTNASKELEELLNEMKINPKRFVHFSLFGKKAIPYDGKRFEKNNLKEK